MSGTVFASASTQKSASMRGVLSSRARLTHVITSRARGSRAGLARSADARIRLTSHELAFDRAAASTHTGIVLGGE
eukprot:2974871-Prymnesium_polylepis.2